MYVPRCCSEVLLKTVGPVIATYPGIQDFNLLLLEGLGTYEAIYIITKCTHGVVNSRSSEIISIFIIIFFSSAARVRS